MHKLWLPTVTGIPITLYTKCLLLQLLKLLQLLHDHFLPPSLSPSLSLSLSLSLSPLSLLSLSSLLLFRQLSTFYTVLGLLWLVISSTKIYYVLRLQCFKLIKRKKSAAPFDTLKFNVKNKFSEPKLLKQ
jgi:hypothetical protein